MARLRLLVTKANNGNGTESQQRQKLKLVTIQPPSDIGTKQFKVSGESLHQMGYLVRKIQIMLTNLSKSFCFKENENNYSVNYIFKNEPIGNGLNLVVDVSVNDEAKITHTVKKPTATLYQSNELIEKMIIDEIVLFSN